ncbi:MAG: glycosyltransferase [Candidatus Lokiarchaeota archaeon]|nr:glycosyltransferase [Candidatus Lokiarchaeota archaeon]
MKESNIVYIGTFPPRECGIATFTRDLMYAMDNKFTPSIKSKIVLLRKDDSDIVYNNKDVLFEIIDKDRSSYIEAAEYINSIKKIKLVCIQHEFGIFGGEYGELLIDFLKNTIKPVVISFHSVIPNPDKKLKEVVQNLAKYVSHFIVMSKKGIDILKEHYNIHNAITLIPHGTPTVAFQSSKKHKINMKLGNKIILSSFGLINKGKGYEYVIDALPKVVKLYSNVLFLIIGATHPVIKKNEGEVYREFLKKKVNDLDLQDNVRFINKYLDLEDIIEYLLATDIYISSGLNPDQIVSGTLSYAMSCGRVPISTPFNHAKDIITPERGFLAKFKDSNSFSEAILKIISDSNLKTRLEKNCYSYTRSFIWPNVAMSYFQIFYSLLPEIKNYVLKLPKIKFDHLLNLTDDFGMIQFANYTSPDINSGYTLDDNARALLACCLHYNLHEDQLSLALIKKYLNFIRYIHNSSNKLYNYVDYDKNINLEIWCPDAYGRAMWALGFLISLKNIPNEIRYKAHEIFKDSKQNLELLTSPRAIAFTLIGLCYSNSIENSELNNIKYLSDILVNLYNKTSSRNWNWFENYLTYSNSKLPESLFHSYKATGNEKYLRIAKESLNFLIFETFNNGSYSPIGQNGWYLKGKNKAKFDQQPVDVGTIVQTLLLAHEITGDKIYHKKAIDSFKWFLGNNHLNLDVYDSNTGGCHDGFSKFSLNFNQGGESTVSYLLARLTLSSIKKKDARRFFINTKNRDIYRLL